MALVTTATGTRRISARAAGVSPSATLTIDAKAKALQAAGERVIGFGAGEPDFPTPAHVVEAAIAACRNPRAYKYTPTPGLPELRSAIAEKTRRDSGYDVTPQQVIVTNGGKQAVANAFTVLCDPGDEVLVCAPYWTTYPESVMLAGGVPVSVLAGSDQGFRVTVEQLDAATTTRTKVLLFVSPSNPTGVVYPKEEIEEIGRWAADRGLWVVADEIYEHLVYGDAVHHSMPVLVPDLGDRCIVVNGVAKTYAMTGWRVGWMIGPVDAVTAASNVQSHETSNVANVSQYAALAAVEGDLDAVMAMRHAFDRRRKTMVEMLRSIPGVGCEEPMGAFYAFPDVRALLGKEMGGRRPQTSEELAEVCIDVARVAVVPGEAFGAPGYLRLSYAIADDAMVEGVTRLGELFGSAR